MQYFLTQKKISPVMLSLNLSMFDQLYNNNFKIEIVVALATHPYSYLKVGSSEFKGTYSHVSEYRDATLSSIINYAQCSFGQLCCYRLVSTILAYMVFLTCLFNSSSFANLSVVSRSIF